jgi:hypothetical protein
MMNEGDLGNSGTMDKIHSTKRALARTLLKVKGAGRVLAHKAHVVRRQTR